MKGLVEGEGGVFPDEGLPRKTLEGIGPAACKSKRKRRQDGCVERAFLVKELEDGIRNERSLTVVEDLKIKKERKVWI